MSEIAQNKLNEFALFRNFLFSVILYFGVVYKKSVDGASVRQEAFI